MYGSWKCVKKQESWWNGGIYVCMSCKIQIQNKEQNVQKKVGQDKILENINLKYNDNEG